MITALKHICYGINMTCVLILQTQSLPEFHSGKYFLEYSLKYSLKLNTLT